MPDYIVCTRARKGGSFSSEPGSTRYLRVPDKKCPEPNHEITRACFVAADVAFEDMADTSSNSNSLYRHCVRRTNYYISYDSVPKLSNVKRIGVAPRAYRVGLPADTLTKAVGVDCGVRFLNTHTVTNPVIDTVSHGWYFDDPMFYNDLSYTLAGDMDRHVIPTRDMNTKLILKKKFKHAL